MDDNTYKSIEYKAYVGGLGFTNDADLIYFLTKELLEAICIQNNYRDALAETIEFIQNFEESEHPEYVHNVMEQIKSKLEEL